VLCASFPLALPALCPEAVRCRAVREFAGGCVWAAAAELAASARDDVGAGAGAADVGAGGGGSAECSAVESGAGKAGSDGCVTAAVGGGADERVGASVSAAGARATGGVAASGAEARTGGGAVKGFGGGARSGGTIRNPATANATTAPPIIRARDGVLVAAAGALNLGACALAPCLTARSAATCAACASTLRRANSLGLLESSAEARL
jgi:hypothetical protein